MILVAGPKERLEAQDLAVAMGPEGKCPKCGGKAWIGGPEGGMSQNMLCSLCLSEFNVLCYAGQYLSCEPIDRTIEDRKHFYGI
jgi:hypothetical protein